MKPQAACEHTHETPDGFIVKCYHQCKNVLASGAFWVGVTVSFPIEHFLWTKVPGFSHIAEFLGLISHLH